MRRLLKPRPQTPRPKNRERYRPELEILESRCLMSGSGAFTVISLTEAQPNDTLDVAQLLGDPSQVARVEVSGAIGSGTSKATDVDWYSFSLETAAHVNLKIAAASATAQPVLSLYNANPDPFDFSDPYALNGHRLLGQTADHLINGQLEANLTAGTYYVAVSGSGNRYFHPFLADSGYPGQAGPYRLTVAAVPITRDLDNGSRVLATDPAANAALDSSPFVLRVTFDTPVDFNTLIPGYNVRLLYSATGHFGDGTELDIYLNSYNYVPGLMELQLLPGAPLAPGFYQIFVMGDASFGDFVVADENGVALGADLAHPLGANFTSNFRVVGIEGQNPSANADDTSAHAHDLGQLGVNAVVHIQGAIGDDPYYDVNNPDLLVNPSADVDMYHFRISGAGIYSFQAEAFAGRIGSPADSGISLFWLNPATHQLVFVDGNNNTGNLARGTDGNFPLLNDAALFAGLTKGDYYVAITSNYNTPTRVPGFEPATNGIFDPNVTHSGDAGFSTGPYVLNLMLQRDLEPPRVVQTTPAAGEVLSGPPTELAVRFSESMNLLPLYFQSYLESSQQTAPAVFIQDAAGTQYFPRLALYDDATNTAYFTMLDGIANGAYALHLSGSLGLTDLAGRGIVANDLSGDYVVHFSVDGVERGVVGDPLQWSALGGDDSLALPQEMGPLFANELQAGITITRTAAPGTPDSADYFKIELLQNQKYALQLTGASLPTGARVEITDLAGNTMPHNTHNGRAFTVILNAGTYVLRVDGWTPGEADAIAYALHLTLIGNQDNPPTLTTGPAPALQLRLFSSGPTAPIASPLVLLPANSGDGSTLALYSAPAGTDRALTLVSFVSNADSAVSSLALPAGLLLQLASAPLGGLPNVGETGAANDLERFLAALPAFLRLAEAAPGVTFFPRAVPTPSVAPSVADLLVPGPGSTANTTPVEIVPMNPVETAQANPEPNAQADAAPVSTPKKGAAAMVKIIAWLTALAGASAALMHVRKERAVARYWSRRWSGQNAARETDEGAMS